MDLGRTGTSDADLARQLLALKRPVFFTQDQDFFRQRLLHPGYGLVLLDTRPAEVASAIQRFVRHPNFKTQARRLGVVARVHADGVHFWRAGERRLACVA
ncbi:MAG TPA: hypothetical protein PKE47_07300 [Verrucomicrobiota bacterium]|nr:hypothetical protein [Verrucomicrobiota bacterium]